MGTLKDPLFIEYLQQLIQTKCYQKVVLIELFRISNETMNSYDV